MPTLILRFPGGRYHATPWGHHVNEGMIEWPPSPWRLLRALLSVGYTSLQWREDSLPSEARSLIERLAGVLPSYRLPRAVGAHTRHYMPLGVLEKNGLEKRTLVFDTWAQVDDGDLVVHWDAELTEAELALLSVLTERLGYLGRSESWVVGRLAEPGEALPEGAAAFGPDVAHTSPGPGWEQTPLLAPLSPEQYAEWLETATAGALAHLEANVPEGKKPTKRQRENALAAFPPDLLGCLQVRTNWLRTHGWSQPPGSQRVLYWRKTGALENGAPKPRLREQKALPVEAMLLSIATATANNHALPSATRTLPMAETLHRQSGYALKYLGLGHSPALSGCYQNRTPLSGSHDHAHIVPLDLDTDGHLDHFLIWAPMGLDADAQAAVRAVRRTFTKGGIGPLRLALAGAGHLADYVKLPGVLGTSVGRLLGLTGDGSEWISRTPFVPPRYLKPSGRNSLEGQIGAELAARGLPVPCGVTVIEPRGDDAPGDRTLRHRHYVRMRRGGPAPPVDWGFTLALTFDQPLQPNRLLALGYGCHFGLGLFEARDQSGD